jgi:hypothetical protein
MPINITLKRTDFRSMLKLLLLIHRDHPLNKDLMPVALWPDRSIRMASSTLLRWIKNGKELGANLSFQIFESPSKFDETVFILFPNQKLLKIKVCWNE